MGIEFEPAEEFVALVREADKRAEAADQEWVEAQLALAAALYEARQQQPGDREFGRWLFENDLVQRLNKNERAALLSVAQHPDLFREKAAESGRRSVQHLWVNDMQPCLPQREESTTSSPEPPDTPAEEPEMPELPAETADESVTIEPTAAPRRLLEADPAIVAAVS